MSFSRGLISVISSSGSIWDKSSWRGSFIFVFCGAMASFFSISLLVIAIAADHWMDITVDREAVVGNIAVDREAVVGNLPQVLDSNQVRYYTRTSGLFRTCFPSLSRPTAGVYLSLVGEWCTTNPPWTPPSTSTNSTTSFTSPLSHWRLQLQCATPLLLLVSVTTLSVSFLVFVSSSWSKSSTRLVVAAMFQLLGAAVAATAMATWHAAWFLHDIQIHADGSAWPDTQTSLGWSYTVAWAGIALSLIASLASASAALARRKRRKMCHEDRDRTELSHNCSSPCHSTSINRNMPSCPAQTPRHSMLSCHSRPSSHGTCHSRPSSHGTCHSRPSSHGTCHSMPSSHGTTLCHHKLSDEMSLGCNRKPDSRDGHSLMPRSCSCLGRERIPYQTNDRSVRIYGQGCECSGNLSCGRSTSETSSFMQKCGRIQDCECSVNLSCGGFTSETSSSRQKSIKWTGNPGEEINQMNGILTSRGSQNHQRLINHSKRFVEKGSYEAGEAVDRQVGEEYGIRIDESFAEEDERNSAKKSDNFESQSEELSEDWDTSRVTVEHYDKKIDRYNKIPHRKELDTSRIERYNEILNSEDLDTCRIERYNKIPDSEDLDTSRIERYNKIPDSEDLDASRIERYNKIPHGEDWDTTRIECYNKKLDCEDLDTSRIERYNKIPESKDLDTSRIERYNKIPDSKDLDTSRIERYNILQNSKDWDSSRIERYNKKMLHILKNTIMHSSDKYIREMLEF